MTNKRGDVIVHRMMVSVGAFIMRLHTYIIFCTFVLLGACQQGEAGLAAQNTDITVDYPTVRHVSAETVSNRAEDFVILDVRKPEEYAVSHLPGAIRVDRIMDPNLLLARLPDLNGKSVIVYCSIGRRSSIFAERYQDKLIEAGAVSVANLQGGAFNWHAENRPLFNENGATDLIHPYDEIWKRYVPRKEKTAYTVD